jgi:hypothetical protein
MNSRARGSWPPFTIDRVCPKFAMRPRRDLQHPPHPHRVQLQQVACPRASAALLGNSKCLSHAANDTCMHCCIVSLLSQ